MSAINAIFDAVAIWFGFVSGCVQSPSGACVPFLAFLALGAAAGAGLVLVLLAYRAAVHRVQIDTRSETMQDGAKTPRERARSGPSVNEAPATA
jgi:hypothetical protein